MEKYNVLLYYYYTKINNPFEIMESHKKLCNQLNVK